MIRPFLIPVLAILPIDVVAQTTQGNRCVNPEEICMGEGCNKRVAVIFGKSYSVPQLKITLIDKNTNKPATGAKMLVHYGFKWLEYPYYPKTNILSVFGPRPAIPPILVLRMKTALSKRINSQSHLMVTTKGFTQSEKNQHSQTSL
jgi:hypothetical protein